MESHLTLRQWVGLPLGYVHHSIGGKKSLGAVPVRGALGWLDPMRFEQIADRIARQTAAGLTEHGREFQQAVCIFRVEGDVQFAMRVEL